MSAATKAFRAERGEVGERLDRALHARLSYLPALSRTRVQAWIEAGQVRGHGTEVRRPAARLSLGDEVLLALPEVAPLEAPAPEDRPLAILYEDEDLLALDKPAGLLVHPTPKERQGTLWNRLLHRAAGWGEGRLPSLVQRLDRDTSGVLLVAKGREVAAALARGLRGPQAEKTYLALVQGRVPTAKGRIDLGILRDPADHPPVHHLPPGRVNRRAPSGSAWRRRTRRP